MNEPKIRRGKIRRAQKIVLYGPEGIGKSTLAAQFPNPLFIDTEGSTAHLDIARFETIESYKDIKEAILYVGKNPTICQTLVVDTVDWAERMICSYILKLYGWESIETPGYGQGYTVLAEAAQTFLSWLTRLTELDINVVLTAHAIMRKFEQPGGEGAYDRWELKLQKKVAPLVKEWADAMLFLNYETFVSNKDRNGKGKVTGGKRALYANHRPTFDAKNRWGLGEELAFSYDTIKDYIYTRDEKEMGK